MVVSMFELRGRPRFVAVIDDSKDTEKQIRYEFYDVCADFKYRDIVALSRCLNTSPNAIERWKYRITFPGEARARRVIDWVKAGKPMKLESAHEKVMF